MEAIQIRIYVGLKDKDNRLSNYDMVPYKALFDRFCRDNLSAYTNGATIYDAQGMWKGAGEESRVIEILITDQSRIDRDRALMTELAVALKVELNQEAVMMTAEPVNVEFI